MGGICLNWGCIPTKALLRSAEVYRTSSMLPISASRPKNTGRYRRDRHPSRGVTADVERRRVPDEKEQGRRHLGRGDAFRSRRGHRHRDVKESSRRRTPAQGRLPTGIQGQEHHRRYRCPPARPAGDRAGRRAHLDLFRSDGAEGDPQIAGRHRLGRHRRRVRLVLPLDGRRGDGGRSAATNPAGRRCRNGRSSAKRFENAASHPDEQRSPAKRSPARPKSVPARRATRRSPPTR